MKVANDADVRHACMVTGFRVMVMGCTFQPVKIKTVTQYFSVASPSWTVMNVASDVKHQACLITGYGLYFSVCEQRSLLSVFTNWDSDEYY